MHQGTWRGAVCAIKIFDLDKIDPDSRQTFCQEFEKEAILMEKLGYCSSPSFLPLSFLKLILFHNSLLRNHPNVVKFIGACLNPPMLLMEYLPLGCCEKVMKKMQKVFSREQLIRMVQLFYTPYHIFLHLHP